MYLGIPLVPDLQSEQYARLVVSAPLGIFIADTLFVVGILMVRDIFREHSVVLLAVMRLTIVATS